MNRLPSRFASGYALRSLMPTLILAFLMSFQSQSVNALTAFDLIVDNAPAMVVYQGENPVVQTAIDLLAKDANLICDQPFRRGTTVQGRTIIVGIPDQEQGFRNLLKQQKVGYKDVVGKWEAFK
ncbi:MAG: hypothetical protein GXY09_09010, partial [Bacteroidales bacterium]|nr:hypothetical protein [Bacteroidales bacterium]